MNRSEPDAFQTRYQALFSALNGLPEQGKPLVLAVDGPAAGGKTTLAKLLKEKYGCAVISMDHFFLPLQLRVPERFAQPGGNVHFERFAAEVSPFLGGGRAFSYRAFDCRSMEYTPPLEVPASKLTVVEGSYSLHPGLEAVYDLKVYLTVSPAEQRDRILRRNAPELARRFFEEWIPMEEVYAGTYGIAQSCDLVF